MAIWHKTDSPRSYTDALSKKCYRIHKTRQNKRQIYKKRTRDICNTRCEIQINKTGSTILKEWTTPDFRNKPSTTNLKQEEIVDALGNDGNASMPKQDNRPNPCRKMMMMMTEQGNRPNPCRMMMIMMMIWQYNARCVRLYLPNRQKLLIPLKLWGRCC
jgi:hypothetical protein